MLVGEGNAIKCESNEPHLMKDKSVHELVIFAISGEWGK